MGEGIEPAEEGDEGGVPVDGNLVGGVGFVVVDVGFVWMVRWIDGVVHVALVLLAWIRTTNEHAWERSLDRVGLRDAVVGVKR